MQARQDVCYPDLHRTTTLLTISPRLLPKTVQTVLFSATFPEEVVLYAVQFAPQSNQLTLKAAELTVEGIKQLYLDCPSENAKYNVLVKLYGLMTIGSSIIFVKVSLKRCRLFSWSS